ncbi:MAG: hypothetical protein HND43_10490 [Armatimonadetes bacterium]|jgi:hypothetical protein|nr:hypothetical protein [Armatimonadota bacterium]NOG39802.1 hypothetical protein [Armatimonadota bacterium]
MSQKFFKTTITVEVISEECPVSELGLADIAHQITQGDCSGEITNTEVVNLTPGQAAQALIDQGSDPDFLGLGDVTPEPLRKIAIAEKTIAQMRDRLKTLEGEFNASGGRGVKLAEEIDYLRAEIESAERGEPYPDAAAPADFAVPLSWGYLERLKTLEYSSDIPVRHIRLMAAELARLDAENVALRQEKAQTLADTGRICAWLDDPARKPAVLSFTEGAERQLAYRFEGLLCTTAVGRGRDEILAALKESGLTYPDCLPVLAAPEDDPYVEAARQLIAGDNDLSIDDRTITSDSASDGGVWVLGWIWVSDEEAGVERKESEEVTA